jgi:hypothetical protein
LSLRDLGATGFVIGTALALLVATGLVAVAVGSGQSGTAASLHPNDAAAARGPRGPAYHRVTRAGRDQVNHSTVPTTSTSGPSAPPSAPTTAAPVPTPTPAQGGSNAAAPAGATPAILPISPATTTTLPATPVAPAFSWAGPTTLDLGGSTLTGVACPAVSLCVATDKSGDVFTSTDLSRGVWGQANVAGPFPLGTPSCPSPALCVIPDMGGVVISTDPGGGSPAWSETTLPAPAGSAASWEGVSCPSTTLCVAVGRSAIATSTDPTGGTGAWTVVASPDDAVFGKPDPLDAVSCPIASFCVAVGALGMTYASTNPTGGTNAWTGTETDTFAVQICGGCVNLANSLVGVSCPTPALCVAIDPIGDVLTSTDPGAIGPSWTITALNEQWIPLNYVTCLSGTYCLAGTLYSWSEGNSGWFRTGFQYESSVACPDVSTCVAVAGNEVRIGSYAG